ncbi:MAG: Fic family protein, partial [Coxiellaceae bacterium]|nr:Fic family protein [Coxiellaceae bacterium]
MATPSEKLAESLEALHHLQKEGVIVIQPTTLARTHRERLIKNGYLQSVMKGWYIPTSPNDTPGDSTGWYASYWNFCSEYLNARFGDDWCISPEQSISLLAGNWTVPTQLLVRSSKANNNMTALPHNTSLYDARLKMPNKSQIIIKSGIRMFSAASALVLCSPEAFTKQSIDIRALISSEPDASAILNDLLEEGKSVVAGRLAGAFRTCGREKFANEIIDTMKIAGYDVRESNPFKQPIKPILSHREQSPHVNRMKVIWDSMRQEIIDIFPPPKQKIKSQIKYLKMVDDVYVNDAYHSLSIEGYRVSPELIERVRSGQWNPDRHLSDMEQRNALAARGYWLAFQNVKKSLERILNHENPGTVVYENHGSWYKALFEPCVTAGILIPSDFAGYRRTQVYIRHSMHVPPSTEATRELMPAFFELLKNEDNAAVRIVLGHFFFVNIHPYMDGNGRIGRFLMNVMFASGNYPWVV